ncbi:MAG: LysE family transporter [Burkholderiales bacterium]|nr:LysE family transporter [Burkholderiales bacterium]
MELLLAITGVLGAIAIGAISPGPSFVLVARTAIAGSRKQGLAAALGMGVGATFFASLVLLGLQVLLASVPWLYLALKLLGGAYLVYLAVRIWRGAKEPIAVTPADNHDESGSLSKAFLLGLFTQISNPKTAVVYGGIFSALLPQQLPYSVALTLPLLVFVIEAGWYALVAVAMSSSSLRVAYLRSKANIDRIAGGVMGLLGLKLVLAAKPSA